MTDNNVTLESVFPRFPVDWRDSALVDNSPIADYLKSTNVNVSNDALTFSVQLDYEEPFTMPVLPDQVDDLYSRLEHLDANPPLSHITSATAVLARIDSGKLTVGDKAIIDSITVNTSSQESSELREILVARKAPITLTTKEVMQYGCEDQLIEGMLRVSDVGVLCAPPKTGKSWLAMYLGACVATGTSVLGKHQCKKATVVYVDGELGCNHDRKTSMFFRRLKTITDGAKLSVEPVFFRHINTSELIKLAATSGTTPQDILRGILRDIPGEKFVVIDPLRNFLWDTDENDNSAMGRLFDKFQEIAYNTNSTVFVIHHTKKGFNPLGDNVDSPRGAGALAGAVSAIFTLYKHEQKYNYILRSTLRSFKDLDPMVIFMEIGDNSFTTYLNRKASADKPLKAGVSWFGNYADTPEVTREEVVKLLKLCVDKAKHVNRITNKPTDYSKDRFTIAILKPTWESCTYSPGDLHEWLNSAVEARFLRVIKDGNSNKWQLINPIDQILNDGSNGDGNA